MKTPPATNEDFDLSTPVKTTVLELAELIWNKIHKGAKPFRYVCDPPFKYDVQERSPDVTKSKQVLGFEATTSLSKILDTTIPWVQEQLYAGKI